MLEKSQKLLLTTRLEEKCISFLRVVALLMFSAGLVSCGHKEVDPSGADSKQTPPASTTVSSPGPSTPGIGTESASGPRKIFKTGEAVPAGYLGYKVYSSWFVDHLPGKSNATQAPGSNYLFIDLSVANTDKKERAPAALTVIDEKGKEYALSAKAESIEKSIGQISKLSPSVSKRVLAVFEAPKGHAYQLKLHGFTAAEELMIQLTPTAAAPAR